MQPVKIKNKEILGKRAPLLNYAKKQCFQRLNFDYYFLYMIIIY